MHGGRVERSVFGQATGERLGVVLLAALHLQPPLVANLTSRPWTTRQAIAAVRVGSGKRRQLPRSLEPGFGLEVVQLGCGGRGLGGEANAHSGQPQFALLWDRPEVEMQAGRAGDVKGKRSDGKLGPCSRGGFRPRVRSGLGIHMGSVSGFVVRTRPERGGCGEMKSTILRHHVGVFFYNLYQCHPRIKSQNWH